MSPDPARLQCSFMSLGSVCPKCSFMSPGYLPPKCSMFNVQCSRTVGLKCSFMTPVSTVYAKKCSIMSPRSTVLAQNVLFMNPLIITVSNFLNVEQKFNILDENLFCCCWWGYTYKFEFISLNKKGTVLKSLGLENHNQSYLLRNKFTK